MSGIDAWGMSGNSLRCNHMFREESAWIRDALRDVELPPNGRVLNLGSSSIAARAEQPWIEADVLAPLGARGLEVVNADLKAEPGVDVVCDIEAPGFDPERQLGGRFDLVLFNNVLPHVRSVPGATKSAMSAVRDGGLLLATVPRSFRKTWDPVENGYRASLRQLLRLLEEANGGITVVAAAEVRTADPAQYLSGFLGDRSAVRLGRRVIPVPGFVDQVRLRVPPLRWRESCALVRVDRAG